MNKIIYPLIVVLAILFACEKENATPPCIQLRIDSAMAQPKTNPPARVDQYSYKGETVFLVTYGCCDQYNVLYDENCNYICAPSGGFTGAGDGRCTDFFTEARHARTIWTDTR